MTGDRDRASAARARVRPMHLADHWPPVYATSAAPGARAKSCWSIIDAVHRSPGKNQDMAENTDEPRRMPADAEREGVARSDTNVDDLVKTLRSYGVLTRDACSNAPVGGTGSRTASSPRSDAASTKEASSSSAPAFSRSGRTRRTRTRADSIRRESAASAGRHEQVGRPSRGPGCSRARWMRAIAEAGPIRHRVATTGRRSTQPACTTCPRSTAVSIAERDDERTIEVHDPRQSYDELIPRAVRRGADRLWTGSPEALSEQRRRKSQGA